MKTRKLGTNGPDVSAIGLGCMGMSIQYGTLDDAQSMKTIQHALDIGVTLINTADAYGAGKNEELIAKAIAGRRDEAILNSKFGQVFGPGGARGIKGHPDYVVEACEASLKRLNTDHIDIYSQHRVDANVPIEDTVGAMAKLVEQGKVRYLGLSEAGPETIKRAAAVHPIVCVETEYSLWTRDVEAEILPLCIELGISLMPYAPIGRGFLSGTIRAESDLVEGDRRRDHPRFAPENIAANIKRVETVEAIAQKRGATPAQIAIAWVLAQHPSIVPIPGTKRTEYLDQNAAAVDIELTTDEIETLREAFPVGATAGLRYPEAQMGHLGR